ncbi:hypothetical protein GGH95_004476 [Coemansia sp. RSA 1836]|nr:hypothetical protein GGF38_003606 [Coemansia sp. RSA 25]KAJ2566037.1 hypothetical protein GGH95_004476 [Coemansia sp. RSA 1836]
MHDDGDQITTVAGLVAELTTELRNHEYGIHSSTEPAIADGTAHTTLTLRGDDEALVVGVALSRSGYTVTSASTKTHEQLVGKSFETLTALLSSLSPAFNSAMHRALCLRLMPVAAAQQEQKGSDDDR